MTTALRPIPGFEGLYSASEDGRVWSEPRIVMRRNGVPMTVRGRWLKQYLRRDGYYEVTVHRGDLQHKAIVHQVVAAAWLPPRRPEQVEVNHKDACKTNNALANLEWCTPSENRRHAMALGLMRYHTPARRAVQRRLAVTKRKLSVEQAQHVKTMHAAGASFRSLAKQFGVTGRTVARISRGETYLNP